MPSAYPVPPYERMSRSVVRIQLDVQVPEALVEVAQDVLREKGSAVTQELDGSATTGSRAAAGAPPGGAEYGPTVRGCFLTVADAVAARDAVLALEPAARWSVDQTFWYDVEAHYALFHPVQTAKFWVGPPWRAREARGRRHRIVVNGDNHVFGDLGHPTTAVALAALERLPLKGRTVLDAGCGTGVLSIAAKKLGARRVLGADLDALEPARALAKAQRVKVTLEQLDVSQLEQRFDVVVCNMHMDHLVPLVPKLFTLYRQALVLSGFPKRYRAQVLGARVPSRIDDVDGYEAATFGRR